MSLTVVPGLPDAERGAVLHTRCASASSTVSVAADVGARRHADRAALNSTTLVPEEV